MELTMIITKGVICSYDERDKFIDDVSKVYRNLYMYDNAVCKRTAEHFALIFGFRTKR